VTTPATDATRRSVSPKVQAVLLAHAQNGDEAAFEALIRIHQDRLFAVAMRMTGNVHDAQDVVQEALVQAWQNLPAFRQESQLGTWLIRITINQCHSLRRRPLPIPQPPDDHEPGGVVVEDLVEKRAQRDLVTAAIAELPFEQRAALVLHTFDGRSQAEVARLMGCTESAVKVRIHRARRTLLRRLGEGR
jgi:RNA polymerase sigma-70 factor (ECF subfamily)